MVIEKWEKRISTYGRSGHSWHSGIILKLEIICLSFYTGTKWQSQGGLYEKGYKNWIDNGTILVCT